MFFKVRFIFLKGEIVSEYVLTTIPGYPRIALLANLHSGITVEAAAEEKTSMSCVTA